MVPKQCALVATAKAVRSMSSHCAADLLVSGLPSIAIFAIFD
jgi:hypothetical protein